MAINTIAGDGENNDLYGTEQDDLIDGKGGDDWLHGSGGNDTLAGGAGFDYLDGGSGNNTYLFGRGDGTDHISSFDPTPGKRNVIVLGDDLRPDDIVLEKNGDMLILMIRDSSDRLEIPGYFMVYNGPDGYPVRANLVEEIYFADGARWDLATVMAQAQLHGAPVLLLDEGDNQGMFWSPVDGGGGNDALYGGTNDNLLLGGSGNDTLDASWGDDVLRGGDGDDTLYGGVGNDFLQGGAGNDVLSGGAGFDTYRFARGDGQDTILDASESYEADTIELAVGIVPGAVELSRSDQGTGNDLVIALRGTADRITVAGYFNMNGGPPAVRQLAFADGTVWNQAAIGQQLFMYYRKTWTGTDAGDAFWGGDADDLIDGGHGDDSLFGGEGANVLLGGAGNDTLNGGMDDDTFDGGAGIDLIEIVGGNDVILFGRASGSDTVIAHGPLASPTVVLDAGIKPSEVRLYFYDGDAGRGVAMQVDGSDAFLFLPKFIDPWSGQTMNLQLRFADGTTWDSALIARKLLTGDEQNNNISGTMGDDVIDGRAGHDDLHGLDGNDTLDGGAGDDFLFGDYGNDTLRGGDGNDLLDAGAGDDILDGGKGDDFLHGEGGNETYLFSAGDGHDTILPSYDPRPDKFSKIVFGAGIAPEDVTVRGAGSASEDLIVSSNGGADEIRVANYNTGGDWTSYSIQLIEFADGTTWKNAEIQTRLMTGSAAGETIAGSSGDDLIDGKGGDDVLLGESGNDTLLGGDGQDLLQGHDGSDTLEGGTGNDWLHGGDGGDTYVFKLGDGFDKIEDLPGMDAGLQNVRFGAGIAPADVHIERRGDSLYISYGNLGDQVEIHRAYPDSGAPGLPVDNFVFADGTVLHYADLAINKAPFLNYANPDLNAVEGQAFSAVFDGATFVDDNGDKLSYEVTLAEGAMLPSWLSFDPVTLRLSGTPGMSDSGVLELKLNGKDSHSALASDFITLTIANVNNAPIVRYTAGDMQLPEGYSFGKLLPAFSDPDTGDLLTRTVTLQDGAPLPSWITYYPDIDRIGGVADFSSSGTYPIKVTVTDSGGLSVSSSFSIIVTDVNRAPVLARAIAPATIADAELFSLVLPSDTFTDPDAGDSGVYLATGLPNWLQFDGSTRAFSGTPSYADIGSFAIGVKFTDNGGLSAQASYTLTVAPAASVTLTGGAGADTLTGKSNDDTLRGLNGDDQLNGMLGNDTLDGGAGADTMAGGAGNDAYLVDSSADVVIEASGAGIDQIITALGYTLGADLDVLNLTGLGAVNGSGNGGHNLLKGNGAANTLAGLDGNDILQGGGGNDILNDSSVASNLFAGGAGDDRLNGGAANEMFIGGAGVDTIATGGGADIIVFNRGDGQDIVTSGSGADNTVSLGGGIRYADLALKKSGNDLILMTGASEQITFKGWYASAVGHSVTTLQVVLGGATADNKVEQFNFEGLAAAFDQVRSTPPSGWSMAPSLAAWRSGGSDSAAIGGDLAFQYAVNGSLSTVSVTPALAIIGSASFGTASQALLGSSALSDGTPMLY